MKRQKTTSEMAEREAAAAVLDRGMTLEEAAAFAGLASVQTVKTSVAREEGRRAAAMDASIDATPLSATAQKKFDIHKRKLEKEFDHRVWVAARKLQDEWNENGMKHWNERLQKLERQLAFRSGVMKASEYKTLLLCCHPDTAANIGDGKRNEAVRILTEYKLKLMNEKEDPFVSKHGMPSVADLQKAREEVRARNSARSKAAWATRREQK